jgi:flagellar assembly protein FliH
MGPFILPADSVPPGSITRPATILGGRPRLLKADAVAARNAAVAREAAEVADRERQASLQDAWAQGFAAGRAAAEQEGASAALRGSAALDALAADVARLQAATVDATESALVEAVLELTSWVLRADPSQASRSLLDRLSLAARSLTPGAHTVVRCSEEDLEAVTDWARAGVEVVADPRLAPGEARLDRGEGSAVLTFSAALRRAAETLATGDAGADT